MKLIVDGIATEYRDEGEGPVLLFLHGWQDSLQTFDATASMLTQEHRVVRLDLPGFGGSEIPKGDWHLDDYAGFVEKFREKLRLDVDVLVGHSLGGRIVIKGCSTGIFHPRKIVLIASAGVAKRDTMRNRGFNAAAKIGKTITRVPPLHLLHDRLRRRLYAAATSDYLDAGAMRKTFLNIIAEDLSSAAAKISLPTLLIWGSADTTTTLREGVLLSQLIRGSRLEVIETAGHFVHKDHAEDVARLINTFSV